MTAALVLTGAPGTGKSSVLGALTTLLELEGVEYGAIESEQLAWGSPWLAPAQWTALLGSVVAFQRRAGRRLFLVAATTETAEELEGVVTAIAAQRVVVVCLSAPADVVAARIAEREPDAWPGKRDLVERARRLSCTMPSIEGVGLVIDTEGRDPADVAAEVRAALPEGR
jgi:cytidylate kinase